MLKISHLQKNYRGFSLDCSMEVQPGMITGLIGRNGSGKSTTFKALLGLIHPDGGEIEVFGKKAEELKPEDKQKLGVVFADSGFSMYLTAAGVANIMTERNFCSSAEDSICPQTRKSKNFPLA